jgi:acetyltransferase-like isoleucine patch superfamily enzyme
MHILEEFYGTLLIKNILIPVSIATLIKNKHKIYLQEKPKGSLIEFISYLIGGAIRIFMAKIYLRKCNSIGKMVSVNGKPIIGNLGEMILDDEVRVWSTIVQTKLYTGENGKLIVGKNSRLNGVHIDARELVAIGENVRIAPYTIILDSDFHDLKDHFSNGSSKPIYIEDNVWIATRATILKGVRIGKGSVIAAGAIVTKDVPPYCVAAGTPARVIKKIE